MPIHESFEDLFTCLRQKYLGYAWELTRPASDEKRRIIGRRATPFVNIELVITEPGQRDKKFQVQFGRAGASGINTYPGTYEDVFAAVSWAMQEHGEGDPTPRHL